MPLNELQIQRAREKFESAFLRQRPDDRKLLVRHPYQHDEYDWSFVQVNWRNFLEGYSTACAELMPPEGWKLVPVVATEAMHNAARDWSIWMYYKAIGLEASAGCWNTMIAAAPSAPERQKREEGG